jgi:hypothetical protein
MSVVSIRIFFFFFFFCSNGVLTQGLHLEPLHQPFYVMSLLVIVSHDLFTWTGIESLILLISASLVDRITGMSHRFLALLESLGKDSYV